MDTFFEVEQRPHPTRTGPCELPILYRDASLLGLFFSVDLERARGLFDGMSIEPWPVAGKAVATICAWEYRDSSVGAYGEVGLGIQCRRRGTRPSLARLGLDMRAQDEQGIWVVTLPVTTETAYAAGVDLWGYPKYVTPISTSFERGTSVRLGEELAIECAPLRGPKLPGFPFITYTERGGRLIRTIIEVDYRARWDLGSRARVTIDGEGPTASRMRELGMDGMTPMAVFRTSKFRARLPAGSDMGPVHLRPEMADTDAR